MDTEYEHECCRAELLGLPRPTWDEFLAARDATAARERDETEDEEKEAEAATTEKNETEAIRKEGFRRITGGLDELNSILQSTQKKINRFKSVCGSFTNLLKIQSPAKKEEEQSGDEPAPANDENHQDQAEIQPGEADENASTVSQCLVDNRKATGSEIDKLDLLIGKAERAEISLSKQNKQMKKFLN